MVFCNGQCRHFDLARVVGAVAGVQAGFIGDEGDGLAGFDRDACGAAYDHAGISVQAAWYVQRQYRARHRIDGLHQGAPVAIQRPAQADAEQAVYHQGPLITVDVGELLGRHQVHAVLLGAYQCFGGVGRQLRGGGLEECYYFGACFGQAGGGFEGVAAVVARAGQDQDGG